MPQFGPDLPAFAELAPGARRIVAPNPSMMTGPGTNTYLFGSNEIAVVDPGPRLERHIEDIVDKAGAPIRWILATHTHPDHSPGVRLLAERTGAEVLGRPAPDDDHQDTSFAPSRLLDDGDTLVTDEFTLTALHTPGHASNHLCFLHESTNWLVTGDHVIDGSTVVINPPDGNMKQYLESLKRVKALNAAAFLPGHGDRIDEPAKVVDWIIAHRLERENKVRLALVENPELSARDLVPHVYEEIPKRLYAWAERSLLAHLLKLEEDGEARCDSDRWRISAG
jgi:glyoxylase-like metal-dependent hydrolase (beta-lactamase superfamily II)